MKNSRQELVQRTRGRGTLLGGVGDDRLFANAGSGNYLDGGEGNDTVVSEGANNSLFGGAGVRLWQFMLIAVNDARYEVERRVA
ncbi:MAG: hypothetical protein HOP24_11230 [Sideroxydans sp.]|nr:hypothetical protein [Sideroxydans sp.]